MSKYYVFWETEHASDSVGPFPSLAAATGCAYTMLEDWMQSTASDWESGGIYESETEAWNSMIHNCSVSVAVYDPDTDTMTPYWEPTDSDLAVIGWVEMEA